MPRPTLTPLGPPETLLDRVSATLEDAVGVQATTVAPTGVRVDTTVAVDWDAAAAEALAALIEHMLAATRHPAVATFLLGYRAQLGL